MEDYQKTSPDDRSESMGGHIWQLTDPGSIEKGIAVDMHLELLSLPHATDKSLWLKVNGKWRHLNGPSVEIQTCVQNAFAHPGRFEVAVWYHRKMITGVVVQTKC